MRFLLGDAFSSCGCDGFTGEDEYASTRDPPGVESGALVACGAAGLGFSSLRLAGVWGRAKVGSGESFCKTGSEGLVGALVLVLRFLVVLTTALAALFAVVWGFDVVAIDGSGGSATSFVERRVERRRVEEDIVVGL